jgi:hypothetical protein
MVCPVMAATRDARTGVKTGGRYAKDGRRGVVEPITAQGLCLVPSDHGQPRPWFEAGRLALV